MEKIDKKKLALVLVFGIAGTLFMATNVFLPLSRMNKELAQKLKQRRDKAGLIQAAFSDPGKMAQIKKEMEELDKFLGDAIPEEKNTAQLTKIIGAAEKEFSLKVGAINSGEAREMRITVPRAAAEIPCQALAVNMSLRARFTDFLGYLNWLKAQKRLICVERLSLSHPRKADGLTEIDLRLNGYALAPQSFPYLEAGESFFLDEGRARQVLAIPQPQETKFSPAGIGEIFRLPDIAANPVDGASEIASQEKELMLGGIALKANSAVAIINGRMLKRNESIEGYKVVEIKRDKVVLEKEGRRRTLEIKRQEGGRH